MCKMIKNIELTKAGTPMTLGYTKKLTATDVCFPTSPQTAEILWQPERTYR